MDFSLEESVVAKLNELGMTISTAESCTGGLLASRIVNVSGASDVFNQGVITYSNEAKMNIINVKKETLDAFGAVSPETAEEMCLGVAAFANAEVGVGITGIAGPLGGTPDKPVGLVYIGVSVKGIANVKRFVFDGDRRQVRESAAEQALIMIKEGLANA